MSNASDTAYAVGRRQKRLHYWQEWLATSREGVPNSGQDAGISAAELTERLDTYRLLISKLAQATGDTERTEAENRLTGLDRELTEMFDARRLLTTSTGVPSIGIK